MDYENSEKFAMRLDAADPLARFRGKFAIPTRGGEELVYLCGNSLGLMPHASRAAVEEELMAWAELGVEGHFKPAHPWYTYHEELRDTGARLVGANPSEVVYMNGLTVNLNLMMVSFFRGTGQRTKLLMESGAFPSDLYAVQSQLHYHGLDVRQDLIQVPPGDEAAGVTTEDVLGAIEKQGSQVALVLIGAVNFFTGRLFDIQSITAAAHEKGCMVGFDLAHSIGNVTHELHEWGPDFAVWCTYKYLNSGPGAVGGCFVHERHHANRDLPQFGGWWGNDPRTRFQMNTVRDFVPVANADRWQVSNPPVLSMAPVRESLKMFDEAGMGDVRKKSVLLTGYLAFLITDSGARDIEIITPANPEERGSQLSLRITGGAKSLFDTLAAAGVVVDYREPDVIRVAPAPLYNTFLDVWRFAQVLKRRSGDA